MNPAATPINQQRIVALTHAAIQSLNALLCEIGGERPDQPIASLNAVENYEAYLRRSLDIPKAAEPPKREWQPPARRRAEGPECPKCGGAMKLRNGSRGEFWGCQSYPMCDGTRQPIKAAGAVRR